MVRIFKNPRFISKKHHVVWILNIVAIKWQICPVFLQSYIYIYIIIYEREYLSHIQWQNRE